MEGQLHGLPALAALLVAGISRDVQGLPRILPEAQCPYAHGQNGGEISRCMAELLMLGSVQTLSMEPSAVDIMLVGIGFD